MRIIKGITQILFVIISILLAISVIRILVSGYSGNTLSFYTFMDFVTNDLDFDASGFFNAFYRGLADLSTSLSNFTSPTFQSPTGILVIDKILSVSFSLTQGVVNFLKGVVRIVLSPFRLINVVLDFLKFLYDLMRFLFGMELAIV